MTRVSKKLRSFFKSIISLIQGNGFSSFGKSAMIDLKKERNFFETRVIEYQSGGALSWD